MGPSLLTPSLFSLPTPLHHMHLHIRVGPIPVGSTTPSPSTSSSSLPSDTSLQHANLNGNLSRGMIAMFISVGVFLFGIVAFSAWWRAARREVPLPLPNFIRRHYSSADAVLPQGRRQQQRGDSDGYGSEKKPVIFDARTGWQTMDVLKWEWSVPVSGTLVTEVSVNERKAKKARMQWFGGGDDDIDKGTEEESGKQLVREGTGTVSQLQAAVLVQMPSPRRAGAHDKDNETAALGCPVQGELAIGITEVPWAWTMEDHHSRTRKSTTSSL